MGFMSDLADGFVPAFDTAFKAEKSKEAQLQTAALEQFSAARASYAKAQTDDLSRIKTAKATAKEFGYGDDVTTQIYGYLGQGRGIEQIRQDLETGSFFGADGNKLGRNVGGFAKTPTVDAQMTGAGLTPPAAPEAPAIAAKAGSFTPALSYTKNTPTSGYGAGRATGKHSGIDFAMPKQSPVGALQGGVVKIDTDDINGNFVRIKHPDGHISSYAHLDGFAVKDGQEIAAGEVVGFSGNTGRVRGANGGYHLHVGVRDPEGNRIDPAGFIKDSISRLSANQNTSAAVPEGAAPSEEVKPSFADAVSLGAAAEENVLPPAPGELDAAEDRTMRGVSVGFDGRENDPGTLSLSGSAQETGGDIVVEGRKQPEEEVPAPKKRTGDGLGFDAQGRALRSVVGLAGGMDVYNQILGGYKPTERTDSGLTFQPGRRNSGNIPTLQQLYVQRAQASSSGNTEEVADLDVEIRDVEAQMARGDASKDRIYVPLVVPDGKGGAKIKGGFERFDPATDTVYYTDEQGKRITASNVRRERPQEAQDRTAVQKATEASAAQYRRNVNAVASAVPLVGEIYALSDNQPNVLTRVAKGTAWVRSVGKETVAAVDVLSDFSKSRGSSGITEEDANVELRRTGFLRPNETLAQRSSRTFTMGGATDQLAADASLMEAKLLLAAFRFGAMEGTSGQSMSNQDFNNLMTVIRGKTSDVKVFQRNISDFLRGRVAAVNNEAAMLNDKNTGLTAQFRRDYEYDPAPRVMSLDTLMRQQGDKVYGAYLRIKGGGPAPDAPKRQQPRVIKSGNKDYTFLKRVNGVDYYRGADGRVYKF